MKNIEQLTAPLLEKEYVKNLKSCTQIADEYSTYPNKIHRLLKKWGIKKRSQSEAMNITFANNHPTRGRVRTDEEKLKISETRAAKWDDASRLAASQKAKDNWKTRLSQAPKVLEKANSALRETAKKGSKLERFVWDVLKDKNIRFMENESILVGNKQMRCDIYIPSLSLVIEVDGPFHSLPIYGQEKLDRAIKADTEKNSLVLGAGLGILRISIEKRNISKTDERKIKEAVAIAIEGYQNGDFTGFYKVKYE